MKPRSQAGRRPAGLALAALGLVLAATGAEARMYQWINPQTGTTQLTGTPPAWYRSAKDGPRVLVYENGSLIDDTAVEVSRERGESLRKEAFRHAEEQQQLEALRRLELQARRDAERRAAIEREAGREVEAERQQQARKAEEEAPTPESLDQATIERLKAIIAEFDRTGEAPETAATEPPGPAPADAPPARRY